MKEQFQENLKKYRKDLESDPNPDLLKIAQILAGEIDPKTLPEEELDRLFPANARLKKNQKDPNYLFFNIEGWTDYKKVKHEPRTYSIKLENWIPQHIKSKLREAVNNGMTWREFKLVHGNALCCKATMQTELMMADWYDTKEIHDNYDKLSVSFPVNSWFLYPRIKPWDIIKKWRELQGYWAETENKEIPIENLIDDSEWTEKKVTPEEIEELEKLDPKSRKELLKKNRFKVNPRAMSKMVRYFLNHGGGYSGIYRTWKLHTNSRNKKKWYVETIIVFGTVTKGSHSDNSILLEKYDFKNLKKRRKSGLHDPPHVVQIPKQITSE
jgi:hypothetical protein